MENDMSTDIAQSPDAIAILAGSVKRSGEQWVSTGLTEEDDVYGAPGQVLRVAAGIMLAQKYPKALLVPSGGIGYDHRDAAQPLLSEVMRDELIAGGVTASRILLEKESNSTFQQLRELEKLAAKHAWKRLLIVTNRWHVPRVEAMLSAKFPDLKRYTHLYGAEEVLVQFSPEEWKSAIDDAYAREFLRRRIELEEEGIRQIKTGTYRFK
jgi:uncharacterized SAM-binding protein YcdF (DUF218 family)